VSAPPTRPGYHRPALIVLVVVAFLACLGLAWWQWERYESAAGTAQNLGYALQWPLFAGFVVFAYFRFVRLEREAEGEAGEQTAPESARPGHTGTTAPAASADSVSGGSRGVADSAEPPRGSVAARARRTRKQDRPREIPAGILPERPKAARAADPVLEEYNRYLARLHAADVEQAAGAQHGAGTSERSAG